MLYRLSYMGGGLTPFFLGEARNSDDIVGFTLWGDPVYRVKRKRGRPPFEWTEENSFKVSMLLAAGWTNERIAGTVIDPRTGKAISVPTLKRHFRPELSVREHARDQLNAKVLMATAQQAFGGNVGALRLLEQLIAKNDRMNAERLLAQKPKGDTPGKKELRAGAALDAEAQLEAELRAEGNVRH